MAKNALTTVGDLNGLFSRHRDQIAMAVGKYMTPERLTRMALTVFSKTPALHECSPNSIFACVIQSGELGLELAGPLGHAFMIPRKNNRTNQKEATFQVGYKGFVALAYRSGQVKSVSTAIVYERDKFTYQEGSDRRITHGPEMEEDPGQSRFFYTLVKLLNGGEDFFVMSRRQAEKHRDRYASDKREAGVWQTNFDAMALKTTVRMLAKRLPLSSEFQSAATIDEYNEAGVGHSFVPDLARIARVEGEANVSAPTLATLKQKAEQLGVGPKELARICERYGVATPEKLSENQAQLVIDEFNDLLTTPQEGVSDGD